MALTRIGGEERKKSEQEEYMKSEKMLSLASYVQGVDAWYVAVDEDTGDLVLASRTLEYLDRMISEECNKILRAGVNMLRIEMRVMG